MAKTANRNGAFSCKFSDWDSTGGVEMWATGRIPFEPKDKDEVKEARDRLKKRVNCLAGHAEKATPNQRVRHAVYRSPCDSSNARNARNASDVENILTYNIDVWTSVTKEWPVLRFEQAFCNPPVNPELPGAMHHYSYRLRDESDHLDCFDHYKLEAPRWEIDVDLSRVPKVVDGCTQYRYWFATSKAIVDARQSNVPKVAAENRFALKVQIGAPNDGAVYVKKLLDGIITAMHPYEPTSKSKSPELQNIDNVVEGIGRKFPDSGISEECIKHLLTKGGKPLPPYPCFTVKSSLDLIMNPADHNCDAVEVHLDASIKPDRMCVQLFALPRHDIAH